MRILFLGMEGATEVGGTNMWITMILATYELMGALFFLP
jgi:hypothetical protein